MPTDRLTQCLDNFRKKYEVESIIPFSSNCLAVNTLPLKHYAVCPFKRRGVRYLFTNTEADMRVLREAFGHD